MDGLQWKTILKLMTEGYLSFGNTRIVIHSTQLPPLWVVNTLTVEVLQNTANGVSFRRKLPNLFLGMWSLLM